MGFWKLTRFWHVIFVTFGSPLRRPKRRQEAPGSPQEHPKRPQEAPKSAPGGCKRATRFFRSTWSGSRFRKNEKMQTANSNEFFRSSWCGSHFRKIQKIRIICAEAARLLTYSTPVERCLSPAPSRNPENKVFPKHLGR